MPNHMRLVARGGFEPPKPLGRQIYSLLRLTAPQPRRLYLSARSPTEPITPIPAHLLGGPTAAERCINCCLEQIVSRLDGAGADYVLTLRPNVGAGEGI